MTNSLFNEFNVFGIFPKLSNITNSKTVTGNIRLVVKLFGNPIHNISLSLAVDSASVGVDPAKAANQNQVIEGEGSTKVAKKALDTALKITKSKPPISAATSIVYLACIPAASSGLCVACGILIAKTFGSFLLDCRSQIKCCTSTKHIKLQDFPNGKMLKVNRRNNLRHYRIYQKYETDVNFDDIEQYNNSVITKYFLINFQRVSISDLEIL